MKMIAVPIGNTFLKKLGKTVTSIFIKLCCLSWTRYWFSLVHFIYNQYCYFSLYTIEPSEYLMLNTTVAELNGARDRSPRLLIIIYWQTSEYLSCDVCCTDLNKLMLYIFFRIIFYTYIFTEKLSSRKMKINWFWL